MVDSSLKMLEQSDDYNIMATNLPGMDIGQAWDPIQTKKGKWETVKGGEHDRKNEIRDLFYTLLGDSGNDEPCMVFLKA